MGLNDSGQIVGSYVDRSGHKHGFLRTGRNVTTIDAPGATATSASGINNQGQIVGSYLDRLGHEHGFLDNNGRFTTLDAPGAAATLPEDINDSGQIVGSTRTAGAHLIQANVFRYGQGRFTTIRVPGYPDGPAAPIGGTYLHASGIDNAGEITISAHNAPGSFSGDAFLAHPGGRFTDIVPPGTDLPPTVEGINNRGQVVGNLWVTVPQPNGEGIGHNRVYLLDHGRFTSLEASATANTYAQDLNNAGLVVGTYEDASGTEHGFLATPAPARVSTTTVQGATAPGFIRPATPVPA
ncbi:hypothetical protein [Rhodovastum atsumiense]|uniref:Uncharacterized protein n=1 Tax=Rhodovastum atsumiense TaxID=504468 RepID=A0A5M6ITP1_9PROT|nr:hypothetical protein [Rhodovastum atsumiense]KAA5611289.1 hypothetical protein F1189_15160 [Rhodovastum atsumiense]